MRTLVSRLIFAFALAGVLSACSPQPEVKDVNVVRIEAKNNIIWNGMKVDSATLDRLLTETSNRQPTPEIRLVPGKYADAETVAVLLAEAQRKGVTHIGFTGIETVP